MIKYFSWDCVSKQTKVEPLVTSIPARSLNGFFLEPWSFDFSEQSKYGQLGRFPSNHQYSLHFGSFLQNGLETHREAIDVKFNASADDTARLMVHPWSVGFVDGQTKLLIIQSIMAMLCTLDTLHRLAFKPFLKNHGIHMVCKNVSVTCTYQNTSVKIQSIRTCKNLSSRKMRRCPKWLVLFTSSGATTRNTTTRSTSSMSHYATWLCQCQLPTLEVQRSFPQKVQSVWGFKQFLYVVVFLITTFGNKGLANRTAEKTKPSALDLMLLFKESVRLKQASGKGKQLSLRENLFARVADYNKSVGTHRVPWFHMFLS